MNKRLSLGFVTLMAGMAAFQLNARVGQDSKGLIISKVVAPIHLADSSARRTVPTGDPSSDRKAKKEDSPDAPKPKAYVRSGTPAQPIAPVPPAAVTLPAIGN